MFLILLTVLSVFIAVSRPSIDEIVSPSKAFERFSVIEYILYAKFMPKKNLNSVIWLLQPNIREQVSISRLPSNQMSQSTNNGPKLFITLLKTFALTVPRVVQRFAKESLCSKLSSFSISNFLLLLLKVALFWGKTLQVL